MKKLLFIIAIILTTTNLFSQTFGGAYNRFDIKKPMYIDISIGHYTISKTYSFVVYDKNFVISYEEYPDGDVTKTFWVDGEVRVRNLYLYRQDGSTWKIACDKPLRVDYFKCLGDYVFVYSIYYPRIDKSGCVNKLDGGNIEIILTTISNTKENPYTENFVQEKIVLEPIGNEEYHVK